MSCPPLPRIESDDLFNRRKRPAHSIIIYAADNQV